MRKNEARLPGTVVRPFAICCCPSSPSYLKLQRQTGSSHSSCLVSSLCSLVWQIPGQKPPPLCSLLPTAPIPGDLLILSFVSLSAACVYLVISHMPCYRLNICVPQTLYVEFLMKEAPESSLAPLPSQDSCLLTRNWVPHQTAKLLAPSSWTLRPPEL